MFCIVCKHLKKEHSEIVGCLNCACHLVLSGGYLVPVAHVSREIADAFGMTEMPNVVVHDEPLSAPAPASVDVQQELLKGAN